MAGQTIISMTLEWFEINWIHFVSGELQPVGAGLPKQWAIRTNGLQVYQVLHTVTQAWHFVLEAYMYLNY